MDSTDYVLSLCLPLFNHPEGNTHLLQTYLVSKPISLNTYYQFNYWEELNKSK